MVGEEVVERGRGEMEEEEERGRDMAWGVGLGLRQFLERQNRMHPTTGRS